MTQHTNAQQNHFQQRSRYQQSSRDQHVRKEALERDLRYLERHLVALDVQIDAFGEKGRALEIAKQDHMRTIPLAIAQVALSTLGVRFLPPVARTWYYKHQQYLRAEEHLKQHALILHTRRNGLVAQIEQIEIQIEMLQFNP